MLLGLYKQLTAAVKPQLMLAWRRAEEKTRHNPRKTAMAMKLSKVPERIITWKKPIPESNYQPSKSAMVHVHHLPATATKNVRDLPIQEANYDPTKSLMVTTSPSLPIYMKTATVIMTP